MSKLRVPSLQHLARIWRSTPQAVEKELLRLARNSPTFSYDALKNVAFDFLKLGISKEQALTAVFRKEKREFLRTNLAEIVSLMHGHCENVKPQYVQAIAPQYYPLGRNLRIPFSPTLMYSENDQIVLPWYIFWRNNPLTPEQYSLFVTLVMERLLQDPALENAQFQILDFSAHSIDDARTLKVINTDNIAKLTDIRKNEMLSIFAEGFERAQTTLQNEESTRKPSSEVFEDLNQLQFLDI